MHFPITTFRLSEAQLWLGKFKGTSDELVSTLSLPDWEMRQLENIRLEKRKKEWLSAKILLRHWNPEASIQHLPNGKPILPAGPWISLSHCNDRAAMCIAPRSCGCDLQQEDRKILTIRNRFANEAEHASAPATHVEALRYYTTIWSAKEAIFKCFGQHVDFANHIHIQPFLNGEDRIHAEYRGVHGECTFVLNTQWIDNYCLVSAVLPEYGLHEEKIEYPMF